MPRLENNRIEDTLFGIYLHNAPDSILRNNMVVGKDLPISRPRRRPQDLVQR